MKTHDDVSQIKLVHITTIPVSIRVLIDDQITYMQDQGFEIYTISSPGELVAEIENKYQVTHYAIPMTRQITPLQDIIALLRIWRQLRMIRPQIVHSHTPKAGLLGTLAARLAGVPVRIYQMRGLRYVTSQGIKRRVMMRMEALAFAVANSVICNSHSVMQQVAADKLCPPHKLSLILNGSGNGVDTQERFNPARLPPRIREEVRRKYNIPLNSMVIGSVGRIVRDKGIIELAQAMQVLKQESPTLYWLVVGPFETENAIPNETRAQLEHDERIIFTDYIDPDLMPHIYAAIDILVFPSYREGFPLSLLEASAMEVPIITTNALGCVDAVIPEQTGIIIPVKDVDALTQAIRRYLSDPALGQAHAKAARLRAIREFERRDFWNALHEKYHALLNTHVRSLR